LPFPPQASDTLFVFLENTILATAGSLHGQGFFSCRCASSVGSPGRRFPGFTDCGLFQAIVRGGAVQTTTCRYHAHPSTPPLLPVRPRVRPARLAGKRPPGSRLDSLRSADAPPSPHEPPPPVTAPDTLSPCRGDGSARRTTHRRQSNIRTETKRCRQTNP
jgi:hypothetical protein